MLGFWGRRSPPKECVKDQLGVLLALTANPHARIDCRGRPEERVWVVAICRNNQESMKA